MFIITELRTICNQIEELHFDSFDKQVDTVKNRVTNLKKHQLHSEK